MLIAALPALGPRRARRRGVSPPVARRLLGVPPQPAAQAAPPGCLGCGSIGWCPRLRGSTRAPTHGGGGGAWAAARRGRAHGRLL